MLIIWWKCWSEYWKVNTAENNEKSTKYICRPFFRKIKNNNYVNKRFFAWFKKLRTPLFYKISYVIIIHLHRKKTLQSMEFLTFLIKNVVRCKLKINSVKTPVRCGCIMTYGCLSSSFWGHLHFVQKKWIQRHI